MALPPSATLKIEEIAFGGDGVARQDGMVWFVPGVAPGELVQVKVSEEHPGFIRGSLEKILETSADRVSAPCPYYGDCGGCSYQHLSYEAQCVIKTAQVRQVLRRIGRFDQVEILPIVPSPKPYGFRNRITVHCEGRKVGFFSRRGNRVVDIAKCLLAEEGVNERLLEFRKHHPRNGHRTLRTSGNRAPFEQTNPDVAAELLKTVLKETETLTSRHFAVDAFCGAGFFTRPLAGAGFDRVTGLDWSEPAVQLARELHREAENLEFECGGVESLFPSFMQQAPDLVLLDPPREGLPKSVAEALAGHPPEKLLYVSCNPATFARDARRLVDRGFFLEKVTPFDMFPQTAEIELLGVFAPAPPKNDISS